MKKILFHIHRKGIVKSVELWQKRGGERTIVILMAFFIGAVTACATAVLHVLVSKLDQLGLYIESLQFERNNAWYWILLAALIPLAGITISFIIQKTLGGKFYAKSLSPLILALYRRRNSIPLKECFTHLLSSGFAVGFGGSAGLEAPSVLTGAAIGANSSSLLGIDRKQRNLLIGCGAAGAISGIFSSPIGGVLFAVEVLLPEFSVAALVPMLISSATAMVVSRLITSGHSPLMFASQQVWADNAIPFYFMLAIFSSLIGVYVIRTAVNFGRLLKNRIPDARVRLLISGILLCIFLFIFPALRGQGYHVIEMLFRSNTAELCKTSASLQFIPAPLLLGLILTAGMLLKVITSVFTVEGGGDGGIFAPSMVIGAFAGFTFARLMNLTGWVQLSEANFVVAGMCGVFTSVMKAPLTGIFLIAEVTGGYMLLVPLMIVSATSWFISRILEPYSIYRKPLAESHMMVDDRDQAMLKRIPVRLAVNTVFQPLAPSDTVSKVNVLIRDTGKRSTIYPVLDSDGKFCGVVRLEKILTAMLDETLSSTLVVYDLMETPRGVLSSDDDLAWAVENMERHDTRDLPVVNRNGRFIGFVSYNTVFHKYRTLVKESESF
ncbi:MAG: chloride channel protein [Lentisphaeria bacterium]|nr:chloride channel protein [Lentisphaeria bacterium]MBO5764761.1 chloride channel protein [Lentisphaeria bacterium]MBO5992200.1 chloride channel protein [Lentisphaeria bacterium]